MKQSVLTACFIFLAIVAYFGVRTVMRANDDQPNVVTGAQTALDIEATKSNSDIPEVVTQTFFAEPHPVFLTLKGRTSANRTVIVRAGTTGSVVRAPNLEGVEVRTGTLLCQIAVDARQVRLDEASALMAAQQEEYSAAKTLVAKKLSPENRLNTAKANLDAAAAAVKAAEIELRRTEIRAPFSGIFENRLAERGDFLTVGSPCGEIADLDPIRIEAEVSEEYALSLKAGALADISVLGTEPREGKIAYVARTANEATRTFKIEAELPNPKNEISSGLTSQITMKVREAQAIAVSPGLLVLHDDGRLGVRYVDGNSTVRFAPVTVIDDTAEKVWVTGLPDTVMLVSVGQEYIVDGTQVNPVEITEGPAP